MAHWFDYTTPMPIDILQYHERSDIRVGLGSFFEKSMKRETRACLATALVF
jgi:hypothetical protein